MPLTTTEKTNFTSDQQIQVARLPTARFDAIFVAPEDFEGVKAEYRAGQLAKWTAYDPDKMRAVVNIGSIRYDTEGQTIVWSSEVDYTVDEQKTITDTMRPGMRVHDEIAGILAEGPSVDQRLDALETPG